MGTGFVTGGEVFDRAWLLLVHFEHRLALVGATAVADAIGTFTEPFWLRFPVKDSNLFNLGRHAKIRVPNGLGRDPCYTPGLF